MTEPTTSLSLSLDDTPESTTHVLHTTRLLRQRRQSNPYRPAENILLSDPIGLNDLGAKFNVHAPFSVCRLCGAIYQTDADRLCRSWLESGRIVEHFNPLSRESYFTGDAHACTVLDESTDRRERWRRLHERRYHSQDEIEAFAKTGFALTPEAAHRLAPYGIAPLGNLHAEIVDAMATAPRAPIDDAEG